MSTRPAITRTTPLSMSAIGTAATDLGAGGPAGAAQAHPPQAALPPVCLCPARTPRRPTAPESPPDEDVPMLSSNPGPVAQGQSKRLIIVGLMVRIHPGPPERTIIDGRRYPRRLAAHRFPFHRELQLTLPKRVSQRTLSTSLPAARRIVETWRDDYNAVRPHCALGNRAPREFPHQGGRNRPVGF